MAKQFSLKKKNGNKNTSDVDQELLKREQEEEKRLASLIDHPGSAVMRLLALSQESNAGTHRRQTEQITDLQETTDALEMEISDLKLMLYTLLRVIGLSEEQMMTVLTHGNNEESE